MKYLSFLILLLFFSCNANELKIPTENTDDTIPNISSENSDDNNIKIFMPIKLINDILLMDYNNLANEFVDIISPYNLIDEKLQLDWFRDSGYINPMIVNIDEEPDPEIVAIFGISLQIYQVLLVFKKIENNWYLLYYEPFYVFYKRPELHIANNYSQNKAFFIRKLHDRGTGLFRDAYYFYKLIDGRVYPCLGLLNEVGIYGWGLLLNQDINTDFKFNDSSSDELFVTYNYRFFLDQYHEDFPWKNSDLSDISFVKGKSSIKYLWDNSEKIYKPYYDNHGPDSLTEEKIQCFLSAGDDELFIKAFGYEINKTLENGTEDEKKVLKWYIDSLKENK